ncbi:hypothetical protein GH714_041086 [Hevea brasiliensis]|uniref:Integrase catalytic domain-containing protein n=1 Tax=Hevea brasiliensis TaxID=3981 RepID=A0A6A6MXE7_HEVBR|nr:hypothetical protein GH714_041086 [Hevea brasiliensis]
MGEHLHGFHCGFAKGGLGNIMVVVDRLSKYAVFMPTPAQFDAKEAAKLFFQGVVKYWGLPRDIVSDQDARFTGRFWTKLFSGCTKGPKWPAHAAAARDTLTSVYTGHVEGKHKARCSAAHGGTCEWPAHEDGYMHGPNLSHAV